ncbi:hypothetical protein D3Z51_11460 [Clostridiaceae bacterium]|nr:hypothetical protein [Clostridiaceae bacterium]RKI13626.1 hypothetical protein D7V81_10340 [bacterium 1XD21-70]
MYMKLAYKKSNRIDNNIFKLILFLLIKWLYIYITISILYPLNYGLHQHYGINFNVVKEVIASVIFSMETIFFLVTKRKSEFEEILLYMLFIMYYIPLNSIASLVDASYEFLLFSNLFFFLIIFAISCYRKRTVCDTKKLYNIGKRIILSKKIRMVCFAVCFAFILYKISFNGLDFSLSMSGDYVYTNRLSNHEAIQISRKGITGILITILEDIATYAAPFYLLVAIQRKKIGGILVSILCILSRYSIYSMKGDLLLLPVVIAICIICNEKKKYRIDNLMVGSALVVFTTIAIIWIKFGKARIYMLIVRRLFYMPTWLNTIYYDFFSQHAKLFLTDEVFLIKRFLPHVYDSSVLKMISEAYFQGEIVSPNNGLFSEGYMQFGLIGILVYPFLYKLVFDWADHVYKPFGKQVQIFIAFVCASSLLNVGMFRTDFVMHFFSLTFIVQMFSKLNLGTRVHAFMARRRT